MNKHAIYHRPESNYCFAIDEKTVVLRIRFAKDEKLNSLSVLYNSKYDIAKVQYRTDMPFLCSDPAYDYYSATIKLDDPRLSYVFEFSSDEGKYYFCETGVKESYDFSVAYYDSFQYAYINKNDNKYECGIVIEGKHRNKGYSKIGLKLLCEEAFKNGINELYDNFEKDRENTLKVFESIGFKIIEETKWKKFGEYVDGVVVCVKKEELI